MNNTYEKIMSQNGLSQFKALIKKWEALSNNIIESPFNAPIMLPDILLSSHSGSGRTHLLSLLAEYLSENNKLMDFYGDVKYFEFMLNYCKPSDRFTEIQRLMTEVSDAAGFRNEYRGIVYIDVDEWINHCNEKHFLDFLEYMSDNSDKWLVVISVTDGEKGIDELKSVVSAFLRIEHITVEPPTEAELTQYLYDLIFAYGINVGESAKPILFETVKALGKAKYFDGYKTVKRLAQDIVYSVFSKSSGKVVLEAEDVQDFSATSDYVLRTLKKIEVVKRIGF